MEFLLDPQEFRHLLFFDRGDRNTRPARDYFLNVFPRHNAHRSLVDVVLLSQQAQALALFALLVRIKARFLELVVRDGILHAVRHELDALLHVDDLFGERALPQLYSRTRLVN